MMSINSSVPITPDQQRTLHIFGGGLLTGVAEAIAIEEGWRVVVRTGKRFVASLPTLSPKTQVYVGDNLDEILFEGGLPSNGDIGFSFSAPWIISQRVIDLFSDNIFNLHAQPLPKFRGGGGSTWLILMGESAGGCCIHRLVQKIDSGAIYARREFNFPADCRYPEDYDDFMLQNSIALLKEWLPGLLRNGETRQEIPVDETKSEYWPRLNTDINGWINWSWPLKDIASFCDAFSRPFPGAQTILRGGKVRLLRVRTLPEPNKFHSFQCGLIYRMESGIAVAHPDGTLLVDEYLLESPDTRIVLGDRLYTPEEKLHEARTRRIQYTPSGKIIDN